MRLQDLKQAAGHSTWTALRSEANSKKPLTEINIKLLEICVLSRLDIRIKPSHTPNAGHHLKNCARIASLVCKIDVVSPAKL